MKLKLYYLLFFMLGIVSLTACSDDDNDEPNLSNIPTQVVDSFKAKYPQIDLKQVKWETKNQYTVAEFNAVKNIDPTESWFETTTGKWAMTETDYDKDLFLIPTEIGKAFAESEYGDWTIDDINLFEYPDNTKDFYMFEVEKATQTDMLVLFKTDGTFIKAVKDTNSEITPDTAL